MYILEAKNISKSFSGINALEDVTFGIKKGEILTVLGENGAGKSTLMNILTGIYKMDGGEIFINGKKTEIFSPQDSIDIGIGMVHQHFMLVQAHTVFENILISLPKLPFFLSIKDLKAKVNSFIDSFSLNFDIDTPVYKLSVSQQQWIEIIKLLIRDCKILILDEPTAVLTPQETSHLFAFLINLKQQGKSIFFISHKMKEVMKLSDRVIVLKKGFVAASLEKGNFNQEKLAKLMIGNDQIPVWEREHKIFPQTRLELKNITVKGDYGISELNSLSLNIKKGEILGITGVAGNGQKALAEALAGLRDTDSGQIIADGEDITNSNARHIYIAGIAHIPEDRKSIGIAPDLSVEENLVMKDFRKKQFKIFGIFQNKKEIRKYAQEKISTFAIKAAPQTPIKVLSGGNMQKVIIARELSGDPSVLLALYPTRGLDIGSAEYVHKVMSEAAAKGMSILLISEDLDELIKMSDRLAVIFRGEIVGELEPKTATRQRIGLLMSGCSEVNTNEI